MERDVCPLVYNDKHYVIMANDIVRGKQDMTLQEARIIRLLITQVVKEDKDLKTYSCKITELAEFLNIPPNNLYRDINTICDNLIQRIVRVGTGNPKQPWEKFQWIQLAKYDGNGTLTLMLSNQIQPYVIELNEKFTQYRLENILELSSFYSIRLYELFKSDEFKGSEYLEYSLVYLREFFECENKYKLFSDFRINVIEVAIKEINDKTDFKIKKIDYVKKGRAINSIKFYIAFPQYYKSRRTGAISKLKKAD